MQLHHPLENTNELIESKSKSASRSESDCQRVKVKGYYMSQTQDDVEQIQAALGDLRLDTPSSFRPFPIPIVTHTADAKAETRPNRLGIEKLTHAPLNFRVFPETPYSIDEFQARGGKRSTLGKGAMGNVQLVRWMTHPDKPLKALKRISKFQMWKDDNPVVLFEQLWDEIEALLTLKHKNIIGLDGYFEDYKYVYLIMEYAPNGDLNQLLENQKRLSELEVARHIKSLIEALIYCHERSYLHRDIKPENLLISKKGDLLLADFGCVATRHSTKKSLCGTRYYHSYEIANEEAHDAASDAWSVGVVTFELLYGKSPFESDDESEEEDDDCDSDSDDEEEDDDDIDDDGSESDYESESEVENEESEATRSHRESETETTASDYSTSDQSDDEDDGGNEETEVVEPDRSDYESNIGEIPSCSNGSLSNSREDDCEKTVYPRPQHLNFDEQESMEPNNVAVCEENSLESEGSKNQDEESENGSSDGSSEDSGNVEVIYDRIRSLDYRFPDFFSSEARDFITRLLQKDKERRMTLPEALNHPFITQLHRLSNT